MYCTNLASATFGNISKMSGNAFQGLPIVSDAYPTSWFNSNYMTVSNGIVYTSNYDTLVAYPLNKLDSNLTTTCSYINYGLATNTGTKIVSLTAPNCLYIGPWAFNACTSLSFVSAPLCSYIGSYTFSRTCISNVSFPNCSYIGDYAFNSVNKITSISLPMCKTIGVSAFFSCWAISTVYLPNCSYIDAGAFGSYTSPKIMYIGLNISTVCRLGNSTAIVPITTTSIYVPSSLIDAYKSATYWSAFSANIFAYEG